MYMLFRYLRVKVWNLVMLYRCNREWGDNPVVAAWYALLGKAYFNAFDERLKNDDWYDEITIEMDYWDELNPLDD